MSGLLIDAPPPPELVLAGRNPGMVVAGWVSRRAGRSGALWGLIFGVFIIVQGRLPGVPKPRRRADQLAHAYGSDVAMNALIGSDRGINTVAGWVDWRFAGILGVLG